MNPYDEWFPNAHAGSSKEVVLWPSLEVCVLTRISMVVISSWQLSVPVTYAFEQNSIGHRTVNKRSALTTRETYSDLLNGLQSNIIKRCT